MAEHEARERVARALALRAAERGWAADQNFWDHVYPRCTTAVYAHENWPKYADDADAAIAAYEAWREEAERKRLAAIPYILVGETWEQANARWTDREADVDEAAR